MCIEPTTALLIASVASAGIQYQTANAQQKAQQQAQQRQNELAQRNAINRYASEGLKIRQIASESSQKGFEASKKTKSAQAQYITQAGDAGGLMMSGSTDALMRDFYRTDGNYKASLTQNLKLNESQFRRNLEKYGNTDEYHARKRTASSIQRSQNPPDFRDCRAGSCRYRLRRLLENRAQQI